MTALACVYTVFADAEEAERIGRMVIDERLAGCVNILAPCRSIYRWNDAVETAVEVPALFKTGPEHAAALADRIAALHSYDVPAISRWQADTQPGYADWLARVTQATQEGAG